MLLLLSVVEDKSLVITWCWKFEGDALVFKPVCGDGQPFIIGIVVNANLKKSVEVMLRLDQELA